MQVQEAQMDDSKLKPEAAKHLAGSVFLQLNALQNSSYSKGYKAARQEIAEHCLKSFGS